MIQQFSDLLKTVWAPTVYTNFLANVKKTAPVLPAFQTVALTTAPAFPVGSSLFSVALKTAPAFPALPPSLVVVIFVFCTACSSGSRDFSFERDSAPINVPVNVMMIPDAVPKHEKRTRAGNPIEYEVLGKRYKVLSESIGYQERGVASWYGTKFHGRKTSNGEVYNMYAMTAAHKTLPIPSYVRVTNLSNQRSVVVRINDRGPFHENRIIDLSYTAAVKLDIKRTGTGFVEVVALEVGNSEAGAKKTTEKFQRKNESVFYLQIGAFSNLLNARQLQNKLPKVQINNSRVMLSETQAHKLYKVQIGPFNSSREANETSKKLMQLGVSDVRFVSQKSSSLSSRQY